MVVESVQAGHVNFERLRRRRVKNCSECRRRRPAPRMPTPNRNNPLEFHEVSEFLSYLIQIGTGEFRVRFQERVQGSDDESDDDYDTRMIRTGNTGVNEVLEFIRNFFRRQDQGEGRIVQIYWRSRSQRHERVKIYSNFDVSVRSHSLWVIQQSANILAQQQRRGEIVLEFLPDSGAPQPQPSQYVVG